MRADGHRVVALRSPLRIDACGDDGVEQSSAVHVGSCTSLVAECGHRFEALDGVRGSTSSVGCVLYTYEAHRSNMRVWWSEVGRQCLVIEDPIVSRDWTNLYTRDHCGCCTFVVERVRSSLHQHCIAGLGVETNGDLVGHGPAWGEQCGILSEHFRSQCFEALHCWIITEHIVSEFGGSHGVPHGIGGSGDGIRAHIYGCHVGLSAPRAMANSHGAEEYRTGTEGSRPLGQCCPTRWAQRVQRA
jgi:hypothetical protein